MVVEDEFLIGSMYAKILESAGYEVVGPLDSCERAINYLAENDVDFATLDLKLFDSLSVPIAKKLEELGVAYVMLTGNDRSLRIDELGLAPVKLLRKPLRSKELVKAVEECLAAQTKS